MPYEFNDIMADTNHNTYHEGNNEFMSNHRQDNQYPCGLKLDKMVSNIYH